MCQLQLNAGFFRQVAAVAAHLPKAVENSAVIKIVMQKKGITVYDQKRKPLAFIPNAQKHPATT